MVEPHPILVSLIKLGNPPLENGRMTPWIKKYKLSKLQVAQVLEDFLEGRGNPWAWDDFTQGMTLDDEYLEKIRIRCANLSEEYPPDRLNEYCNEQGRNVLREYVTALRARN